MYLLEWTGIPNELTCLAALLPSNGLSTRFTVSRLLPSKADCFHFASRWLSPYDMPGREHRGDSAGAQAQAQAKNAANVLWEEEEMINSTCGVSEDCHSMWTDGLEFSGKPVGPEGGHARWREQPDQSPEGVCRLSVFRSHETFAAAGESM